MPAPITATPMGRVMVVLPRVLKRFKDCGYDGAAPDRGVSRVTARRSSPMAGSAHRRPRLEDVAARVGVSTGTVSLVLSNAPGPSAATRERVMAAAAELGYRPDRTASLLARRRAHLLGVMLDVRSTFHAELVAELHDAAEAAGYDVLLSTITPTRASRRAIETLVDSRCEALVLLGPDAPTARL